MTNFKVIRAKYTSDLEEQLNKFNENYKNVKVQCITYDHNINQYTVVVEVGEEILPMTYYSPVDDQYYII